VDYGNVFVHHDGATDDMRALERWTQAHGDFGQGQIRAPFMSPGFYRVCVPRSVMEAFEIGFASEPTGQCSEGALRPGGELCLDVPPPAAEP
jgi:hypothetical protein